MGGSQNDERLEGVGHQAECYKICLEVVSRYVYLVVLFVVKA